jgi:hypothetical protein
MTPEDRLQIAVARFLDVSLPVGAVWFHIANQRQTSVRVGAKLKRMGVKPGIPDLCIVWRGRVIFIELKSEGGRVKSTQSDMLSALTMAGAVVNVCRSLEDVQGFLATIIPLKGRLAA